MELSLSQLQAIMPRMARNPKEARDLLPGLNEAMEEFQITTPERMAAFLAQIAHESCELRYMSEEWEPDKVPAQKRYEPVTSLSKRLGNTKPGDGFKYRGAGPIQLTGRANFALYGKLLKLDLEGNPDLAREPDVGFRIAGLYWTRNHLNALADEGDFVGITKAINGGTNGLEQRQAYWATAKRVLGA